MIKNQWHKAEASNGASNCVEVMETDHGGFLVRDTKDKGTGPVLSFTRGEWAAFLKGVKLDEFEPSK
ncbi:DUF397 domain-containing protein [Actinospica sp. MGRD01-02]|uniref:DUF397 domain-containing protein n=1 Tax=Actinospica acidithermotolerans TaxID=2828514 RepID=A0A941E4G9_9ACTN|nr:DUF397 domain-containing protein [Actinospica acidithermotolerans]MBR7824941.1 DUF397 domain-containing protein [Actinospica acidithermotolerans]